MQSPRLTGSLPRPAKKKIRHDEERKTPRQKPRCGFIDRHGNQEGADGGSQESEKQVADGPMYDLMIEDASPAARTCVIMLTALRAASDHRARLQVVATLGTKERAVDPLRLEDFLANLCHKRRLERLQSTCSAGESKYATDNRYLPATIK